MQAFRVNHKELRELDRFLRVDDPDRLDAEIEGIVENLWSGIGEHEALMRPLFTTYLQSNLLRPLYIQYFSLCELRRRYGMIIIDASTVIVDILARHLGCRLSPRRSMHDAEFYLIRHYDFTRCGRMRRPLWKRAARMLAPLYVSLRARFPGIDVLYLNAGKLDEDLARIPRALSASWIPLRPCPRLAREAEPIRARVRENVRNMRLSIPVEVVLDLVEARVLVHLAEVLDRIGSLAEFIEKQGVRLVIASAATHEDHLCLLAAARLTGVESLLVSHGITFAENPYLHDYVGNQATLNGIEEMYRGAVVWPLRSKWFGG